MAPRKKKEAEGDVVRVGYRTIKKKQIINQIKLESITEEELQKELRTTLADFSLNDVLASLNKIADDIYPNISNDPDIPTFSVEQLKILKADLRAHHGKIFETYSRMLCLISESLLDAAGKIPANIYNLKDALESFAYGLRTGDYQTCYMSCRNFAQDIDRPGGKQRFYSEDDLKSVREQAEEAGYKKGLAVAEKMQSIEHIDLL